MGAVGAWPGVGIPAGDWQPKFVDRVATHGECMRQSSHLQFSGSFTAFLTRAVFD